MIGGGVLLFVLLFIMEGLEHNATLTVGIIVALAILAYSYPWIANAPLYIKVQWKIYKANKEKKKYESNKDHKHACVYRQKDVYEEAKTNVLAKCTICGEPDMSPESVALRVKYGRLPNGQFKDSKRKTMQQILDETQ